MFKFLLPFVFCLTTAQALVLENLIKTNTLKETLTHKKVGYYYDEFDPPTLWHQDTVKIILDKELVDYSKSLVS
jgi:hypothetical protein